MPTTTAMFGDDEFRRMSEAAKRMQEALAPTLRLQQQMRQILEPYQRMQQQIQRALEPYLQMQKSLRLRINQLTAPLRAHQEAMKQFQKSWLPILDTQRFAQQRLAEQIAASVLPSKRIQEQMTTFASKIALAKSDAMAEAARALSERLQDYSPTIEDTGDALVIDGDAYTPADIEQALAHGGVLSSPSLWASLPKPLQWLLLFVITTVLATVWNWAAYNQVPFAYRRHQEKAIVRQAKEDSQQHSVAQERLPFVTKDSLSAHANSKLKSRVLDYLPFGTEVTILQFRNKKRWLLVEWHDGEITQQGWVLGRHVFRPSKYRRNGR